MFKSVAASVISAIALIILLATCCVLVIKTQPGGRSDRLRRSVSQFLFRDQLHKVSWDSQPKNSKIELNDIFIAVKTSKKFHKSRLPIILKTWYNLAPNQTWFFSDASEKSLNATTNGHLINTKCSSSHSIAALNCKMAHELKAFLASNKRWFCHFDDDNYVNIPKLVSFLQKYRMEKDWYLGKTSIQAPLQIVSKSGTTKEKVTFWFGTGGAGFCLNRPLISKMKPHLKDNSFEEIGNSIRLPDDVTIGYIIEHKLGLSLNPVKEFHSHLESLKLISTQTIQDQISFSYSDETVEGNHVSLDGLDLKEDPTRFISIHCLLYPKSIRECI